MQNNWIRSSKKGSRNLKHWKSQRVVWQRRTFLSIRSFMNCTRSENKSNISKILMISKLNIGRPSWLRRRNMNKSMATSLWRRLWRRKISALPNSGLKRKREDEPSFEDKNIALLSARTSYHRPQNRSTTSSSMKFCNLEALGQKAAVMPVPNTCAWIPQQLQ